MSGNIEAQPLTRIEILTLAKQRLKDFTAKYAADRETAKTEVSTLCTGLAALFGVFVTSKHEPAATLSALKAIETAAADVCTAADKLSAQLIVFAVVLNTKDIKAIKGSAQTTKDLAENLQAAVAKTIIAELEYETAKKQHSLSTKINELREALAEFLTLVALHPEDFKFNQLDIEGLKESLTLDFSASSVPLSLALTFSEVSTDETVRPNPADDILSQVNLVIKYLDRVLTVDELDQDAIFWLIQEGLEKYTESPAEKPHRELIGFGNHLYVPDKPKTVDKSRRLTSCALM